MRLKLNNIGIIKEADIQLNGLTVIAGKNDSGKSTISKVLYSMINTLETAKIELMNLEHIEYSQYQNKFNNSIEDIFNSQISQNGEILFQYKNEDIKVKIVENSCYEFNIPNSYSLNEFALKEKIYIDALKAAYEKVRKLKVA